MGRGKSSLLGAIMGSVMRAMNWQTICCSHSNRLAIGIDGVSTAPIWVLSITMLLWLLPLISVGLGWVGVAGMHLWNWCSCFSFLQ